MRILMLSPYFPPDRGGVSDHSFVLAQELRAQGHEVEVITRSEQPASAPNISVRPSLFSCDTFRRASAYGADSILIQYTPHSFAEGFYGIAPWLPLALLLLKIRARRHLCIFAHESHYPVQLSVLGLCVGIPQFLQFLAMALIANQIIFSHEESMRFWQRVLPWKRAAFSVIPVPSNIRVQKVRRSPQEIVGIPEQAKFLMYFGGAHDMNLLDHVLASHQNLLHRLPKENVFLVMAGVSEAHVRSRVPALEKQNVIITGYLPAEDISELLQQAALVLAPFGEGINTRRGSAMAALSHGRPLVSTRGWCTHSDHPWEHFVALSKSEDQAGYVKAVEALYRNESQANNLGIAAQDYYEKNFSITETAKVLVQRLRQEGVGSEAEVNMNHL